MPTAPLRFGQLQLDFAALPIGFPPCMTASFITFPAAATRPKPSRSPTLPPKLPRRSHCLLAVAGTIIGIAYGDGTIGLISNEINYAWTPGSDTAIELAPPGARTLLLPGSPVIYAENGTIALIKVSDRAISTPQLTPEGLPYQRQQTIRELALIPLQDLFSGGQNWTPVAMLDGALFD